VQKKLFRKSNLKSRDEKSLPKHVAIILHDRDLVNRASPEMPDNNCVGTPENHLQQIVETSIETGICHLTLICPNSENFAGPKDKSSNPDLFAYLFGSEPQWLVDHAIGLSYLGNHTDHSPETLIQLKRLENCAPQNHNLQLTTALSVIRRQFVPSKNAITLPPTSSLT